MKKTNEGNLILGVFFSSFSCIIQKSLIGGGSAPSSLMPAANQIKKKNKLITSAVVELFNARGQDCAFCTATKEEEKDHEEEEEEEHEQEEELRGRLKRRRRRDRKTKIRLDIPLITL